MPPPKPVPENWCVRTDGRDEMDARNELHSANQQSSTSTISTSSTSTESTSEPTDSASQAADSFTTVPTGDSETGTAAGGPTGLTSQVPDRSNDSSFPDSGGGGNKKGPNSAIRIWVEPAKLWSFPEQREVIRTGYAVVDWELADWVTPPHHYNLYRDGHKVFTKTYGASDEYEEYDWIPNGMKYTFVVKAADANNNEYASGTYVWVTPDLEDLSHCLTKVMIVPMRMADSDHAQISNDAILEMVRFNELSLKNQLNEMSYGAIDFSVSSYPEEIVLPENIGVYCTQIEGDGKGNKCSGPLTAHVQAELMSRDLYDKYNLFIITLAGYAPRASHGGNLIFCNPDKVDIDALVHETIHYFGCSHSGQWWSPQGEDVGEDFTHMEKEGYWLERYGDSFCPMGGPDIPRHMHAYRKEQCGWISKAQVQTVTAEGEYDLYALETKTTGVVQLRIPVPGYSEKIFYVLEYRAPVGMDAAPLSGPQAAETFGHVPIGEQMDAVLVRLRFDRPSMGLGLYYDFDTVILHLAITPDKSFVDPHRGITVDLVSYHDGYVKLNVTGNIQQP